VIKIDKSTAISRVKLTLGTKISNRRNNDAQFNALKTIMSLVHNGGTMRFETKNSNEGHNCYNIEGMRFDHELDTLEIILQKK